jgi:hypothetical protein
MRKVLSVLVVGGLAVALGLTGQVKAWATQIQICGNGGSGYCLNDWGGHAVVGNPIKMYYGGNSYEDFYTVVLQSTCGGAGYITGTQSCWSQWGSGGANIVGSDIVAIVYGPGGCLGSDQSTGLAIITTCPNQNGTNGGFGTVWALSQTGPLGSNEDVAYSRPWSSAYSPSLGCLESGGNPGVQADASQIDQNGVCTVWGGPGI